MTIPIVGDPLDRVDGRAKISGEARYASENNLRDIAHAALVPATIAYGRIVAIDTTAALKAPGVLAVITHLNAPHLTLPPPPAATSGAAAQPAAPPQPSTNLAEPRNIPLQSDQIHYVGQQIAVVVADSLEQATYAASLVRVNYAQGVGRTELDKHRGSAKDKGQDSHFTKGDADAAFESAPVKIDRIYRTPYEHHNPMEAHSLVAAWEGDRLTVHDSSQNIFAVRQTMSRLFGVPRENVEVRSPFVGGAFGSKGSSWPHVVICVMAAREVKRPVKLVVTRRQLFFTNGHRPETEQHVQLGARDDGRLVAIVHEGISQGNEVCDYNERVSRPTRVIYATDNMRCRHQVVELNVSSPTYMRAPGENPGMFALESAMDELAAELKIDPVELRLRNHADTDPGNGKPWSSKSLKECYAQAAGRFGWSNRPPEPRSMRNGRLLVGWGMASATYPAHRSPASARATIQHDGTVVIACGSHEMGMGTATVMRQLAAETLGLPVERVRFVYGDTTLPQAPISAGSMTAASVGSAVFGAANALKEKLAGLAGIEVASLKPDDYAPILAKHYLDKAEAQFDAHPDPAEEKFSANAFGAHFAEVTVDPDLGLVRVPRIVSAFAAGRVLNAKTARSQFHGGIVQGIGMALLEQTRFDTRLGTFTNVNFAEYLCPTHADIHAIEVILVPEEDKNVNPIGAKGLGEIGIVGVAPAIANAVYHATGKRVRDLPITLEKLL